MQSPTRIRLVATDSKLTRGARADAPRRDTTMTQDSDSGDAAGDAGPTTDSEALCRRAVKIGLTGSHGYWERFVRELYSRRRAIGAVVNESQPLRRPCDRPRARRLTMRLDDLPESGNVEDRRAEGYGGGGFGVPIGGGGLGVRAVLALPPLGWAPGLSASVTIRPARAPTRPRPPPRPAAPPRPPRPPPPAP